MGRVHVDLFSGVGGFSLASEWAGWDVRLFSEIDPYCRAVLAAHWPDVPIHGDIRTLTSEVIRDYGITEKVDLLTGGFPCQPFSNLGLGLASEDNRHLWPEMFRVIEDVRPRYVIGENVRGLVRRGLDDILDDLERIGYASEVMVIGAIALNAPHRRDRLWIIASDLHADSTMPPPPLVRHINEKFIDMRWGGDPFAAWDGDWEAGVSRTLPHEKLRRQKLQAMGNAVVPQIPYALLTSLMEAEKNFHEARQERDLVQP